MNADQIQRQRDKAHHLIAISETPSWPVVKQLLEAKRDREFKKMVGTAVLSQQELDFGRGMLFGFQTFIDLVEQGPKVLEQSIRAAQALEGAEEE